MDSLSEIDELVAHEGRAAGTDAERRAARHLAGRLRSLGRDVTTEATSVHPRHALAHVIHVLMALIGSLAATGDSRTEKLVGTLVVLAAAISAFADLNGSFHLARRLTGRRASQNVVSREELGKPGTLVLTAHYDAARSGAIWNDRAMRRRARISRLLHRQIGPFEPMFWSIMAVLLCCALRLVGVEGTALNAVQFIPTIALIVAVPLLADLLLSGVVPGASDNASGVATVLRLADRYGEQLDSFDVWVLFTGAQESMQLGMGAFLRRHRKTLDKQSTIFLCVDDVGRGRVRYSTREGYVLAYPFHPDLVRICEQLREEDAEAPYYEVEPIVSRMPTDAFRARVAGYPAIAVGCANELGYSPGFHQPTDTADTIEPQALQQAYEFCSELIELIDEKIGPQLEAPAEHASR